MPTVSVITAVFNGERFLEEAIDSVLAQTYADWELLLVNDGSTDRTAEIAKRYTQRHSGRVRYFEHDGRANRGVCASRNLAIQNAAGAYIALLDADDVWLPPKLARQMALLDANPSVGLVCGASLYWTGWTDRPADLERDHVPSLGVEADRRFEPPSLLTLLHPLGEGTAPCPSDLLLTRAVVEQVRGFEEDFTGARQLFEDQAFLAKVYATAPVFIASECWTKYRIHENSCVSVVTRSGHYGSVRMFFLNWLRRHLASAGVTDPAVGAAIDRALAAYKAPHLERDARRERWSLRVAGGNVAVMTGPAHDAARLRVDIENGRDGNVHDIQLNQPRLSARAGRAYRLVFRGKSDASRIARVSFSRAGSPWGNLGLYAEIALAPEWRDFQHDFVARFDDDNARVHFDLGGDDASVDFADVRLLDLVSGDFVEPPPMSPAEPASLTTVPALPEHSLRASLSRDVHVDLHPVSTDWGWDRGLPIDRHYIERFLGAHRGDVRGRVLEVGDNVYTQRFGGPSVTSADVLDVENRNSRVTVVGDLTRPESLPEQTFDCILLLQTLQYVYDVKAAIRSVWSMLAPGGVVLASVPGITRIRHDDPDGSWFWSFTTESARQLFSEVFAADQISVSSHGNVLTATSFLRGMAAEDLNIEDLDYIDRNYEVLVVVRAVKTPTSPES